MDSAAELADGERLRELRLSRLLTQRELGQRAGVAPETINRIERAGEPRSTAPLTVRKLAAALGVEPQEITVKDD